MDRMPASIFNDVLGPVMRGQSSSHTAGAWRIAALIRASLGGNVTKAVCDFDTNGSLAATHEGQGTDMGFAAGILGVPLTDPSVSDYKALVENSGAEISFRILDYGAKHPNHYRVEARGNGASHKWDAVSVGGGMIEMLSFDGFKVSIAGDFCEILIKYDASERAETVKASILSFLPEADYKVESTDGAVGFMELKYSVTPDIEAIDALRDSKAAKEVIVIEPILSVRSRRGCSVPFSTAAELLEYAKTSRREFWQLAVLYESARSGSAEEEVIRRMYGIADVMENAVKAGLAGTEYRDRILGRQSDKIEKAERSGKLMLSPLINSVIKNVTAVMEVKSSMGVIVAAPTVGSCGCLPGTVFAAAEEMKLPKEAVIKALFAAGMVGVFIAGEATFAAEVAGCQVECGSASGMAAAGIAQLLGCTPEQCITAASIALQNISGLACDPVASRVEVPCLGKNIMGGVNAISAATMAAAGYNAVIPLDETIGAIYDIGLKLPSELRCTFGGLGKTLAAAAIRDRLDKGGAPLS